MLLSVIAVIPPQLLSMFNVNIYVSSAQPAFWGTSDPLVFVFIQILGSVMKSAKVILFPHSLINLYHKLT